MNKEIKNTIELLMQQLHLVDIIFMLDKKDSKDDVETSLNRAYMFYKYCNDEEDKDDLVDWLQNHWLDFIPAELERDKLLEYFKQGDIDTMVYGLNLIKH